MDAAEQVAGFEGGAAAGDVVESDAVVDEVGGALAAGAEVEDDFSDDAGIEGEEGSAAVAAEIGDGGGGAGGAAEGFEGGGVAVLGGGKGLEFGPGGAVAEAGGVDGARGGGNGGGEVEDERFEVVGAAALEAVDGFADFEGVACGVADGFGHGVEEGAHGDSAEGADVGEGLGEGFGLGAGAHEGAAAEFDVEDEAVEAFGELFAHNASGDEWNARDGAGDIAEGVEFAVGGAELGGLSGHEDADGVDLAEHGGAV